jgi:DNA (cytosine-5)-methyltransferase 1
VRLGSACTGYAGLDGAVEAVFGAELAWVADNDPDVSLLLKQRYPDVPNLGDISTVEWDQVEPVDIFCGGFPCQDVSCAGQRAGLRPGTRSGVWTYMAYAIGILRPELVVIENVRGICSASAHSDVESCEICLGKRAGHALRALGAVLGDLSTLGYDAEWQNVRASDAGSCHRRERIFITAWPAAPDALGDAGQ